MEMAIDCDEDPAEELGLNVDAKETNEEEDEKEDKVVDETLDEEKVHYLN